ncbi:hypothetical protein [Stenotrophomonas sp.]|uniref:hypothetical protein n=1 Tax=Stenotrophomonas sp. TaxID=69392 RepID=UPI0028AC22D7|nr:hypothetical protein [Stenotrophomonas sp.]
MSWGMDWLGLEEDADERAIKRAYARQLRSTRPDEDPAGFQRLHEAYQAALAWVKYRDGHTLGSAEVQEVETGLAHATQCRPDLGDTLAGVSPVHTDAQALHDPVISVTSGGAVAEVPPVRPDLQLPPVAPPALDVERFARRVTKKACRIDSHAMAQWLTAQPELWSVGDKPRIGEAVLQRLQRVDAPIHESTFDALADCFGWNDVGSGVDPLDLEECRERLHGLWLFRLDEVDDPTVYRAPLRPSPAPGEDDRRVARLRRPWNRLRALMSATLPGRAHEMGEVLARFRAKAGSRPLQPRQIEFWQALNRRNEVNGTKIQLAMFRSALLGVGVAALILVKGIADGFAGGHRGYWGDLQPALIVGLSLLVLGSMILPLVGFVQWQAGAEHPRPRGWIVRLLVIPVLACAALWLMRGTDVRLAGVTLAWPVAALAMIRLLARGPFRMKFSPWMIGVVVILLPWLEKFGAVLAVGEIAAIGALLLWATDAVAQVPLSNAPRKPRGHP